MAGTLQLGTVVAILRKHVVLLAVSMSAVAGAGYMYLQRQQPVWESSATLRMHRSLPGLPAIDAVGINTEFQILRQDRELSGRVVDRLREQGIDVDAAGYTPGALTGTVTISQKPVSELVAFSLRGSDPTTLPAAVNAYAEVYRDFVNENRKREVDARLRALLDRFEESRKERDDAEQRRFTFLKENSHERLDFRSYDNPVSADRRAVAAQIPQLERQDTDDRREVRRVLETLTRLGLRVEEQGDDRTIVGAGEPADVGQLLAEDPLVAGLQIVRGHPEVGRLRGIEEAAEARDRDLERGGRTERHEERVAARTEADDARSKRGWIIKHTMESRLADIATRTAHLATQRERLESLDKEERRINDLFAAHEQIEREVAFASRAFDDISRELADLRRLLEADTDGATEDVSAARVMIEIRFPAERARQIAPNVRFIITMTIVAALGVGLGLVFLFEFLDDSLRSREDFDRYLSLPFLGFVPRITSKDAENPDLAAQARPGSSVAEAFRAIRTSILFSRHDAQAKSMLITSAGPGEGKTTIATNLAATLALHKAPVLLVDADLRRPRVAKALGLPNEIGLTNVLVGEKTFDEVVQETSVPGLFVVTSGTIPPNPAELLHGESTAAFLEEAESRFESVIVDSPPLVAVTDARILASRIDGLYLVISLGKTSRRLIQRSVESLTSIGFAVHGAILNNMNSRAIRQGDDYYYYYQRKTYGSK